MKININPVRTRAITPIAGYVPSSIPSVLKRRVAAGLAALFALAGSAPLMRGQYPGAADVLNPVYRCISGPYYFSSSLPSEYHSATRDAAVTWLHSSGGTGRTNLVRLSNGTEHLDSIFASEGSYTIEGGLGYMTNSQLDGMLPLARGVDANAHHGLFTQLESFGSFTPEYFGAYSYQRDPDDFPEASPWPTPNISTLTDGNLSIQVNKKAGAAIWSWKYNGVEFINRHDYGRLFQGAVFTDPGFTATSPYSGGGVVCNPTEAGSASASPNRNFGSPYVSLSTTSNTLATSCVPMEFLPGDFGGDDDHPVIWSDMRMGKNIILNYGSLAGVAQFEEWFSTPVSLSYLGNRPDTPQIANAFYIKANFTDFKVYDSSTQTEYSVSHASYGNGTNGSHTWDHTGVILTDPNTGDAIGIYLITQNGGGTATDWLCYNFNSNTSTAADAFDCYAIMVTRHGLQGLGSGTFYNRCYVICGSHSDVLNNMDALYSAGAN